MNFATFRQRVGQNVRLARHAAGLTLEGAAESVMTYRLLGELERGHGNPELQTLFELAELLRVTVSDLVDVGERPPQYLPLRERPLTPPKPGRKPKVRRYPKLKT